MVLFVVLQQGKDLNKKGQLIEFWPPPFSRTLCSVLLVKKKNQKNIHLTKCSFCSCRLYFFSQIPTITRAISFVFQGNILLNIMLKSEIPFARQGKNNVTFMCMPHPALDPKDTSPPKATSILLRVKTADDADELLENINKHKTES